MRKKKGPLKAAAPRKALLARIAALERALRRDIAWITMATCPECGVEMTPGHDAQAGGEDGYANEDCCRDAREIRTDLQAVLDEKASKASARQRPQTQPSDSKG